VLESGVEVRVVILVVLAFDRVGGNAEVADQRSSDFVLGEELLRGAKDTVGGAGA